MDQSKEKPSVALYPFIAFRKEMLLSSHLVSLVKNCGLSFAGSQFFYFPSSSDML